MPKNTTLFASADSLAGIKESILSFYCGTVMHLVAVTDDTWRLVRASDAKDIQGVIVRRQRNRFRFETI